MLCFVFGALCFDCVCCVWCNIKFYLHVFFSSALTSHRTLSCSFWIVRHISSKHGVVNYAKMGIKKVKMPSKNV